MKANHCTEMAVNSLEPSIDPTATKLSLTNYDISTEQEAGIPAPYIRPVQQCSEDSSVPVNGETANHSYVVNHNDQSYQQVRSLLYIWVSVYTRMWVYCMTSYAYHIVASEISHEINQ